MAVSLSFVQNPRHVSLAWVHTRLLVHTTGPTASSRGTRASPQDRRPHERPAESGCCTASLQRPARAYQTISASSACVNVINV